MSPEEFRDLRENVQFIRDSVTTTANDVQWLKMAQAVVGTRVDGLEKRTAKVENKVWWFSGAASMIGAVFTHIGHKTGLL